MTIVDKLKEKLHIGHQEHTDPAVPPKGGSTSSPDPPPKSVSSGSEQQPTPPPKDNKDTTSSSQKKDALPALPETAVFDKEKVTVIFVLGGPGAGKGTQSDLLVRDYGFKHLSAGDLLRAEQDRPGSQYGEMIKSYIVEGQIVPMEVTVKLLENAMRDAINKPPSFPDNSPLAAGWQGGKGRFLIDGFPRKMDQALKFDESVCESSFVLFFSTTEEVMLQRIMERGKTSGRSDDNVESLKKRFKTFEDTSMPVVDYYRKKGKVVEIDASPPVEEVYAKVKVEVDQRLQAKSTAIAPPITTSTASHSDPTQTSDYDEATLGRAEAIEATIPAS